MERKRSFGSFSRSVCCGGELDGSVNDGRSTRRKRTLVSGLGRSSPPSTKEAIGAGTETSNSGSGSHYPSLVIPYMAAVQGLLKSTPQIRRVVDLGCGDFNVGQDIAPLVREYIACDVVPELIARNQQKFSLPNVDVLGSGYRRRVVAVG